MKKWQWELRKALKRWKLAIIITDQPVMIDEIELAANEKGIRNVTAISFLHLSPETPHIRLLDQIAEALSRVSEPAGGYAGACVAVMSQSLLDHYRTWTGGWFIEFFESTTEIINKPVEVE